jgi:two-component system alkaline phosphatase synthesis response regulator PhoP
MAARILVVEDEPGLRLALTDRLAAEGYSVESAGDGESGLARAGAERFDLILLDVMLPKKSGFDVCRDLRQLGNDTPVLMLTARTQVADRVVGLKLGADDYVVKPFEVVELLARIEARLRRPGARGATLPDRYRFGEVEIDFRRATATRAGQPVELSAKEYQLLRYFIEHREEVLSRNTLLDEVWGYDAMPTTRTVDVHVAWLRRKIETNPRHPEYILTLHGLGYKFVG